MRGDYILALDEGTTNTKALLVSRAGKIVFRASVGMRVTTTSAGFVEQDANEIWNASCEVMLACVDKFGAGAIAAIGIANQRETVVLWDRRTGEPLTAAVIWQCRRSAARCAQLVREGLEPLVESRTGLRIDPLFSASKVEWLLDHTERLRSRAEAGEVCLGTVDSWLIWKLTGGRLHATDASNASRTQLLNLATGRWDEEMLRLFSIPPFMLPVVVDSSGVMAETAAVDGLPAGIPIAGAIGDSHAALAGHGVFAAGPVKATYGTGSSLMTLGEDRSSGTSALARTVAWRCAGKIQRALEGNITMSGASVEWVGNFLKSETPVETALGLARTVRDAGGVYLVPAMNGLGAPHWDTKARGAIYGLTRTSTMGHLARAAIDAIAHQIADVFEEMDRRGLTMSAALYADGGASANSELMQLQADLLGRRVERSKSPELSALGAAWMAGLGVGMWSSFAELTAMAPERDVFEPLLSGATRDAMRQGWRRAVASTRSQAELFSEGSRGAAASH